MDVHRYQRQLRELEKTLSNRIDRERAFAREQTPDSATDSGETSVADENASEDFSEVELDATRLQEVRAALHRIDDGTYGRCLVDGGAIEAKRLDAVPWAAYCIKHQTLEERGLKAKPTL
jgi:DnaK suppressor protein